MSDRDFQIEVLERLGDLKAEQAETRAEVKAIVARLDRLNGSVGLHDRAISALEKAEARREGQETASRTWIERLAPAAWALLGVFSAFVLQHGSELLVGLR